MIKCANGSGGFVPQFQFGHGALKARGLDDERRLLIRLRQNLFRSETARCRFFAMQPQTRRFGFDPISFSETSGQFGRSRAPIEFIHCAVILHTAFLEANDALRFRKHGPW